MKEKNLYQAVENGVPYSIDLTTRTLTLRDKVLIDHGVNMSVQFDLGEDIDVLQRIRELYVNYTFSVPGEHSRNKQWFYHHNDLSSDDMLYAERMTTAQFALEFFVLKSIITEQLTWEVLGGGKGYFWKDKELNRLVIQRSWVE